MANHVSKSGAAVNLTATDTIAGGPKVTGFYINSTTSGTIAFADEAKTITGTITPAVGWHELPFEASGTLTVTIGGTALDVTVCFTS